jgi:Ca2+-binding RTX toxin-like protein
MAIKSGTTGDDTLYGTAFGDWLFGGDGNDALKGFGGADRLYGGNGVDTAFYTDSTLGVTVNLDTGSGSGGTAQGDRLFDIENLYGSYHNDTFIGSEAANALFGLNGNDSLIGGGGADTLDGGSGEDTADYIHSPTGVAVLLHADIAAGGDAEGDELDGIENVAGSAYDDDLRGDDGGNALSGRNGDDTLEGFGGADGLYGGQGDDALHGMNGADILSGDYGNDYLNGGADGDHLNGGTGDDTMVGGSGNDIYYVHDAGDTVTEYGGQGSDIVRASISWALTAGADVETLRTDDDDEAGAINLTGNATGNIVRGNNGNNILNGGDGNDELTGLGGQDSFLFTTPLNAATNVDVITDFNVTDDTIVLNQAVFGGIGLGTVAGSQFVIGTAAADVNHRIVYNDLTGDVYYDSDGTGAAAAIQFAELSPGLALTNSDFYVNFYF